MTPPNETIVAVSTPPGRGGIGVVRLSGPEARRIGESLVRLKTPLEAGRARFTAIVDREGRVLDEAVVTFFAAPHSYTSEDVVEISAHGAPVLLHHLVEASIAAGARLASPGEFTQRAFLSGRMDLTQAEAVNDLIAAQTLHQARTSAAQLGGSIARTVAPVKQRLIQLIAALEAGVDFAEDDLDLLADEEIENRIEEIADHVSGLAKTSQYGRILREGATLALVGQPNAGKSSLFNRLLERERAIVTAQPGTTRDPISESFSLNGIPIALTDTAGLREISLSTETEAERIGIERSRATIAEADLVLHVVDASTLPDQKAAGLTLLPEDAELQASLEGRPALLVFSKCDLKPLTGQGIPTSARTGAGLPELRTAILDKLAAQPAQDSAVITNLRQSQALGGAFTHLTAARNAARDRTPHEFLLMDLHQALQGLDLLTGATAPDDLLAVIFSTFCIGK